MMDSCQIHIFAPMTSFTCSAPSPEMGRKAQEGATQHVWEGEFWTVSEVERTTEGTASAPLYKIMKNNVSFLSPPPAHALPSPRCSPLLVLLAVFPSLPIPADKEREKKCQPRSRWAWTLCAGGIYRVFFFPFPAFLFFMWLSVQWDLEKVTFIPKGIKRRMLSCTPRVWQLLDGIIYIYIYIWWKYKKNRVKSDWGGPFA